MRHGKKTQLSTLKIISEYAEKIILYMKENKFLKEQLNDLRISLSINKEMLNNQIKHISIQSASNSQISEIIKSLQNENIQITNRNMELYNENLNLEKQLYKSQQNLNEKIENYEEQIKDLNNKIFVLSNQIMEKNNEIIHYKNEIIKLYKDDYNTIVYICPTLNQFNIEMNNELCEARHVIIKYSHLLNNANKLINELNAKNVSLKEMIQNIKDGKRIKRNLENIEDFGYILTEDSNESDEHIKSFYTDDGNYDIFENIDNNEDNNFCFDSPLVQCKNKIKHTRYLTTTTSNDIQVPKLDLSTIIKKYKPIEKKIGFEKKEFNYYNSIHNLFDDRDYIDKLKFKLKFYRNLLRKYKQKCKEQKQIISMLKAQCLKVYNNINTTNCSTSFTKMNNYPISNETRINTNLNGYSMENNISFSMESAYDDENELNIIINEVNREAIGILSESNSFYNK